MRGSTIKYHLSIFLFLVLGGLGWAEEKAGPKSETSGKPNIIFILSDDLGHDILHCFEIGRAHV